MTDPIIVWFRQDLRRKDNPALIAAYNESAPVIPLFILDDENAGDWAPGAASRWWLHKSLQKLDESLSGHLVLRKGDAQKILPDIAEKTGAQAVYWNRCYEPWRIKRDKLIKDDLKNKNIDVESFNGCLLYEPWNALKDDNTPYKVFTPFYKKGCLEKNGDPPEPENAPERLTYADKSLKELSIEELGLLPEIKWYKKFEQYWIPGEDGAQKRLNDFLTPGDGLDNYKTGRNHPAWNNVSRLSPHLHFGEISPRDVWHRAKQFAAAEGLEKDGEHFCSELGWREFSYNLLYYFPGLPTDPLQDKFESFEWEYDEEALKRWQEGRTGYPIVDAGMRELYETGYMHNRLRMIVGSFLVKDMLIPWQYGEKWFWDCLVDADLANNSAGWQWIAGCGADAAPYFRIFNPITQGKKFDPDGEYVRKWVPEIASLKDNQIHAPWEVEHGCNYPEPILDHSEARKEALKRFKDISGD